MKVKSFDDIMNCLLPDVIETGYLDPDACRRACPPDIDLLCAVIESADPVYDVEERALGCIAGIAAGLMGERGEALVLRRELNYVGCQMNAPKGMINVSCDAGDSLGAYMSAGTILCQQSCGQFAFRGAAGGTGLVVGNAGDFCAEDLCGDMFVRVMGSVGRSAGRGMCGGKLRVEGDAGEFFCRYMEGGAAHACNIALLGETYGGAITARRVRALEKGEGGTHMASLVLETRT